MIGTLSRLFTVGIQQSISRPRLLIIVILVVVFPVALLFLARSFLAVGVENFETLQRSRIGAVHDAAHIAVLHTTNSYDTLQAFVEKTARNNTDLTKLRVAMLDETDIVVVAALNEERIHAPVLDEEAYRRALLTSGTPITFEFTNNGIRLWQTFSATKDSDGRTWFILSEQSFESFENVVANRESEAYMLLGVTYLFLILLAYWQWRDIDFHARYDKARQQLADQEQFTNAIAHELRTPLTSIRGYASLIREDDTVPPEIREKARRIEQLTKRQVKLVSDFLDVARMQIGSLKLDWQELELQSLLREITSELHTLITKKNLTLSLHLPKKPMLVTTDKDRLEQVCTNIISNAVKYTKEGSIEIILCEPRYNTIELRVKDTGVGISAADQKKIFTPFYRVENEDTNKIVGTGLGMWITKQIIERLGGTIGIESIKDYGTNVVITLPKTPSQ